jgi:hypothetical protein
MTKGSENISEAISLKKATHKGELVIADLVLGCAVLEDGTRVLSQRGVTKALGGKRGGSHWRRLKQNPEIASLPVYLSAGNLAEFVGADLRGALTQPVHYKSSNGGAIAKGVNASLLPEICDVLLRARDANALVPSQQPIAKQAEILMRGLAHIGIIALVDEATGYQYQRARNALEEILNKFIAKELRPWTKTFPDAFYENLFRLKGIDFKALPVVKPSYFGHITNDIVYGRMAPMVLEELKRITPKTESGHLRHRLHQRLTEEIGHPKLREHLASVMALMRASSTWEGFYRLLEKSYPKYGQTLPLLLEID